MRTEEPIPQEKDAAGEVDGEQGEKNNAGWRGDRLESIESLLPLAEEMDPADSLDFLGSKIVVEGVGQKGSEVAEAIGVTEEEGEGERESRA